MKTILKFLPAIIMSILAATPSIVAADTNMTVRLVRVSPAPATPDPELSDVQEILKRNLPFASYSLMETRKTTLPAMLKTDMDRFVVRCAGPQSNMEFSVSKYGKQQLSTIISVSDTAPVILGGFKYDHGKERAVFVITVKQ